MAHELVYHPQVNEGMLLSLTAIWEGSRELMNTGGDLFNPISVGHLATTARQFQVTAE